MQGTRTVLTTCCLAILAVAGCSPRSSQPERTQANSPPLTAVARTNLPQSLVMGEQSCAASGCHGRAFDGVARDWRAAYSIWREEDPHRRTFEVLYTDRSVEIFRNFHPEAKQSRDPPGDAPFEAFLGQRCLGCHATGLARRGVVALAEARDRPAFYLAGVTCESCHGPASGWLHTHYLTSFSRSTPGFHDTKSLHSRAEACVGCHVGPMIAGNGKAFDVNHDLVAAGHPRLAFEFSAYLANLPKHWDEIREMVSHQTTGQPMTYHIDVWAAGQEQVARQLVRQVEHRLQSAKRDPSVTPWPDFSNFDCYDCHHAISPPGDERLASAQLAGRRNAPRPTLAALESLRLMGGESPAASPQETQTADIVQSLLTGAWQTPLEKTIQPSAEQFAILTDRSRPPLAILDANARWQQHAASLLATMRTWKRPAPEFQQPHRWDPSWDQLLHFYFGLVPLAQDIEWEQPGMLHNAATRLATSLEYGFGHVDRPPTQYDSPSAFPSGVLQRTFDELEQGLVSVANFEPPGSKSP